MSRIAEDDEHPYTAPPTETQIPIRWTAPEALEHREWYTATDVWGYGVMIWEVYSGGKLPYAEFNNAQTRHEVVNNGHRLSKSKADDCPGDVFALLQSCWEADKDVLPPLPPPFPPSFPRSVPAHVLWSMRRPNGHKLFWTLRSRVLGCCKDGALAC